MTGSALASLGLAAADAGALSAGTDAGWLAGAAVGDAPPKPPEHAPTTSAVSMPSAPRRVAVVAMVLLLRSAPVGCPRCAKPGLSSSRLPATMCDRRGGGLSRIDVFLRGIALC